MDTENFNKDLVKEKVSANGNIFNRDGVCVRVHSHKHLDKIFYDGVFSGECLYNVNIKGCLDLAQELTNKKNRQQALEFIFKDCIATPGGSWTGSAHSILNSAFREYAKNKELKESVKEFGQVLIDLAQEPEKHKDFIKKYKLPNSMTLLPEEKEILNKISKKPEEIASNFKKIIYITTLGITRSGDPNFTSRNNEEYNANFAYDTLIVLNPKSVKPTSTFRRDFEKDEDATPDYAMYIRVKYFMKLMEWGDISTRDIESDIFGIVCMIDNKIFYTEVINIILKLTEKHISRRVPIYDCYGSLIWPTKKMLED
jgi:hypothetical protein